MENVTSIDNESFATMLGKAFAINVAATAGIFGGLALVGFVLGSVKKNRPTTTTTEEKK